jgi:class 3 adenylate cyclase
MGCGDGLSFGYATLGRIGSKGRPGNTDIGTVVNQDPRLCAEAHYCDVVLSQRLAAGAVGIIKTEPLGELAPKGRRQPLGSHRLVKVEGG